MLDVAFGRYNIGEIGNLLKQGLYKKSIDNNYAYVCDNRDEFTAKGFESLEKLENETTLH